MPTSFPVFLAQVTVEDLQREALRMQHGYQYLSYGLTVAWLILIVYVIMMANRQRKLRQEIAHLRAMLEDKGK
jgi:CcmD family protein